MLFPTPGESEDQTAPDRSLTPADPAVTISLNPTVHLSPIDLDELAAGYRRQARSANTERAYRSDWRDFSAWCVLRDVASMPADPETVAQYLADLATTHKVATIRRHMAAISAAHTLHPSRPPNPCRDQMVRDVMRGIAVELGVAQRVASAATTKEVRKMVAALRPGLHGARDRCLILIGFAAALRRSELAALDVADLRWVPEGIEVTVRRSKTDQTGEGAVVPVPYGSNRETCPVRAVGDWLELSGLEDGPLLWAISRDGALLQRISEQSVSRVVARAAKRAGLDPKGVWTGHSLRAGLATSAARAGVPDRIIMQTTRHRSRGSLDRYIREGKRWDKVAAASVGL